MRIRLRRKYHRENPNDAYAIIPRDDLTVEETIEIYEFMTNFQLQVAQSGFTGNEQE